MSGLSEEIRELHFTWRRWCSCGREASTCRAQKAADELDRLHARVERLEELVAAKDDLLAAYRLRNDRLADRALTRISKAKAALDEESDE